MTARVVALVGCSVVAAAVSPWLGPPLDPDTADFVLGTLRVPRVVLGALVGATLGLTGAAFQAVLDNPLATPSTVGTTAGAGLGALAVIVLLPGAGPHAVALGAFAGALGTSAAVAGLAATRRLRTEELLLAGIAVTLAAGAATTGLQVQADAAATLAAVRWALGSLATVGYDDARALAPLAVLGAIPVLASLPALHAMAAGPERAAAFGVDVARVRAQVIAGSALGVAACVAVAGPIGFVGLIVPHLVRLAIGGGPRRVLPASAFLGAGFLPLCDGLARVLLPGRDLPVGVLTAALGAPTLVALLWARSRGR